MNYITALKRELAETRATLSEIRDMLIDLEAYYLSDKFRWPDNDYAHVRTDILPRLAAIRDAAMTNT